MGNSAFDETKRIPADRWNDWCVSFTHGNRGRALSIALVGDAVGTEPITDNMSLVAIDCDRPGKGNDFVISYGEAQAPSRHVISGAAALRQTQDEDGRVMALEIEDSRGVRTVITFI